MLSDDGVVSLPLAIEEPIKFIICALTMTRRGFTMVRAFKLSVLLAGVSLFSVAAQAADPAANHTHDWSGIYAGVHAGFGNTNLSGVYDSPDISSGDVFANDGQGSFELESNDFLAGGQIGYNHQIDRFVLGVEGDIALSDWSTTLKYEGDDDKLSADMGYLATIRARAGMTFGDVLVFATGGLALTDASFTGNDDYPDTQPDEVGTVDFNDIGWAFGGGAEYAIAERLSVKADALHIGFDEDIDTADLQADEFKPGDHVKLEDMFVLRFGVNYHF